MVQLSYHASHEQFSPSALLTYAQQAEQAGFQGISCSDHFHPWSERQGQSGFAWAWLGAAMQATTLPFGVVCAPGQRYHPAIIAQAAATLGEMFPDRFWVALGSGQAMNEAITGKPWPAKAERNARLKECVDVMRALWAGDTVTHHGLVCVEEAKLYTRPAKPPQIMGAAITPQTAEWVGGWADGLITISHPYDQLRQVVEAFRRGGGEHKPMYLKAQISYAPTEEAALQGAYDQWRTNIFASSVLSELKHPHQFDAAATFVKSPDLYEHIRISSAPQQHIDWLKKDIDLGFETISLHNVNRDQQPFIDLFGEKILPVFRG
ncbi:MAG: LLM class flavin-dependent oxidoreductase [Leptolyngbya sp. DLM2.Bin27]|nr:MAG: LLM class flavin-dependent oxidoreductase [Leptolyngbya sp. DLM2.Bin27]